MSIFNLTPSSFSSSQSSSFLTLLLLLEESLLLWSPIMLSIVKPDPFEDLEEDVVIGPLDDEVMFAVKSMCLDEVRQDENWDEIAWLILGEDKLTGSTGELSGEGLFGELMVEEKLV